MTTNRTPDPTPDPSAGGTPVRGRIGRRAVVAGAAWSVPAVAVVSAAPAFAASNGLPPVYPVVDGSSCKLPGQSTDTSFGYLLTLCFVNTTTQAATVRITSFSITGATVTPDPTASVYVVPPRVGATPSRSCNTYSVTSTNSANRQAIITYSVTFADGTTSNDDFSVDFDSFRPCRGNTP